MFSLIGIKKENFLTYGIIFWFIILLFGPYFPVMPKLPLRLDHILFPVVGPLLVLAFWMRARKIRIPVFILPLLGFVFVALFSTLFSVWKAGYPFSYSIFFADLENHLRIFLILLLASVFCDRFQVDLKMIIKALFFMSVVLAVFGILQVAVGVKVINNPIKELSINWYAGRHDRTFSIVELCMEKRAVSTFYSPGNFALFCSLVIPFFLLNEKLVGLSFPVFGSLLLLIFTGWVLPISKAFFGGIPLIGGFFIIRKRWRPLLVGTLLLVSGFVAGFAISPYSRECYGSFFGQGKLLRPFHFFLDNRFGSVQIKKNSESGKPEVSFGEEGYLCDTFPVIKKNLFFGVGYVSGVKSGDSMVVHFLIRGGIVGGFFFLLFFGWLTKKVFQRRHLFSREENLISEAWLFSAGIFFLFGIAFPTFIQDRTGDIFWWIGALLAFRKPA